MPPEYPGKPGPGRVTCLLLFQRPKILRDDMVEGIRDDTFPCLSKQAQPFRKLLPSACRRPVGHDERTPAQVTPFRRV